MNIISWNVNGMRAAMKNGFLGYLKKAKSDVLLLQEIKIDDAARAKEKFDFKDYLEFWHPAVKPGYSGIAALIKKNLPIIEVKNGMGIEKFDREGRVQTVEFEKFYLLNAYFPHSNHELTRLEFKLEFNQALAQYVKKLKKKKPLIIGGDFNVAREEIDLARPKDNIGNPGFTDEERAWLTKFLNNGFIDTYRFLNKNKVQYSWWGYRFHSRERNVGWRIDLFCVSRKLEKSVKKAFISDQIMGSDHCPVGIEIKI